MPLNNKVLKRPDIGYFHTKVLFHVQFLTIKKNLTYFCMKMIYVQAQSKILKTKFNINAIVLIFKNIKTQLHPKSQFRSFCFKTLNWSVLLLVILSLVYKISQMLQNITISCLITIICTPSVINS